jgi:hypothetical protein
MWFGSAGLATRQQHVPQEWSRAAIFTSLCVAGITPRGSGRRQAGVTIFPAVPQSDDVSNDRPSGETKQLFQLRLIETDDSLAIDDGDRG